MHGFLLIIDIWHILLFVVGCLKSSGSDDTQRLYEKCWYFQPEVVAAAAQKRRTLWKEVLGAACFLRAAACVLIRPLLMGNNLKIICLSDEHAMWTRPLWGLFCVNCNVCLADSTTTLHVVDSPFTALLGLLLVGLLLTSNVFLWGQLCPSMYVLKKYKLLVLPLRNFFF